MKAEFHQHPDGFVYVRTDAATYADTLENFEGDFGVTIPALPEGAEERVYTQDKRHAVMGDGNIIEGGPMPWDLGDQIIASVQSGLAAQVTRKQTEATQR
jgi:hypothetical protein